MYLIKSLIYAQGSSLTISHLTWGLAVFGICRKVQRSRPDEFLNIWYIPGKKNSAYIL